MNEDARSNAAYWDAQADAYQRDVGPVIARHPRCWGAFFVPDDTLGALGDVAGLDVLELGSGAARWSIELARAGARCTAVDVSQRQLEHAAANRDAAAQVVTLVRAAASAVPLPDSSFDLIFCDHGGLTYDDPALVVPECARLLRPGGRLVFNTSSPWSQVCLEEDGWTMSRRLVRPYFGLGRSVGGDGVTWVLGHAAWIKLLAAQGFTDVSLDELRAPRHAVSAPDHWARRWPVEDLWRATKRW